MERITDLQGLIEKEARSAAIANGADASELRPLSAPSDQLVEGMRGPRDLPKKLPGTKGFGGSPRKVLWNFLANDPKGQKAAHDFVNAMAAHARKKGLRVGMRDFAAVGSAWLDGKEVTEETGLDERLSTFTGDKSPAEIAKDPRFKWLGGEVPMLEVGVKELKRRLAAKRQTGGSLNQIANSLRGLSMSLSTMSDELDKLLGWKS